RLAGGRPAARFRPASRCPRGSAILEWRRRRKRMLFTEVIRKKRDGHELTSEDIDFFVDGLTDGSLPAEQVSALAMAIVINSMSTAEVAHLTKRMAHSGTVLDWRRDELGGPVVDKHSTGGIGDKV